METWTSEFIAKAWLADTLAVDTEGTDAKKTDLRDGTGFAYGISLAFRLSDGPVESAYFPIKHTTGNVDQDTWDAIKILIEGHRCVVGHNYLKHDTLALKTLNIDRKGIIFDTMNMAHWLFEQFTFTGFGLDWCAKFFLKDEGKKKGPEFDFWLTAIGWHPDFPAHVMGIYAAYDTDMTLRLFEFLLPKFIAEGFYSGDC